MEVVNKRIHGRLLMATGIIHILLAILPGVFGEQWVGFAGEGFFSVSDGLAEFPLFGGTFEYDDFAAFWFLYAGLLIFMYGHVVDNLEVLNGYVPRGVSMTLLVVSFVGAYMVPLSGMTFVLIPQGIYMLLSGKRNS